MQTWPYSLVTSHYFHLSLLIQTTLLSHWAVAPASSLVPPGSRPCRIQITSPLLQTLSWPLSHSSTAKSSAWTVMHCVIWPLATSLPSQSQPLFPLAVSSLAIFFRSWLKHYLLVMPSLTSLKTAALSPLRGMPLTCFIFFIVLTIT